MIDRTPRAILKAAEKYRGTARGLVLERLCDSTQMHPVWSLVLRHKPSNLAEDQWAMEFGEKVFETYQTANGHHKTISALIKDLEDVAEAVKAARLKLKVFEFADPFGKAGSELEIASARIETRLDTLKTATPILPRPNIDRAAETYFVRVMAVWLIYNLKGTHLTRLADLACCVFGGEETANWLGSEFCNNAISKWDLYGSHLKNWHSQVSAYKFRSNNFQNL